MFLFSVVVSLASAAEPPPEHVEFFEAKIRPILVEHCYKCHSAEAGKSKGDLLLDSRDALRKGGVTGAAIVPGEPEKSLLIEAIRYKSEDLQMPPPDSGGKLSDENIALLETWIRMGAPDPRIEGVKPHPLDMNAARDHWAFQPIAKPAAPAVKNNAWLKSPVDRFVLAKLEAKALAPASAADKRTLLRRVTYDLTGLPPTAGELDAFLADRSPDAYPRIVDKLLASPRYGERWARFWLDVARYADTKGYLAGNAERRYPFSFTYRDYVIRSFNEDKPFDRFIVEQLAADRLPLGDDKSALAALGFLTLGRRFLNNQNDIIDDRIDVVTRGLMGLTVSCARCHDHKFDPIPTKDYYSLHGVFASSEEPEEKPLLGPLIESPAYQEFVRKKAAIEAKIAERSRQEVQKFLATTREKSGDYLLGAHDFAQLPKTEKLELFAGARKLNVEVLKRWQSFLADPANAAHPVLAPWFALARLPESEFAEKAAGLVVTWKADAANGETPPRVTAMNRLVRAAFTNAETPLASLKDAAAIYNRLFASASKSAAARASEPIGADEDAIRRLLFADDAPPNLADDAVVVMLRREINNKTASLKREREALNWTEPGAPLRAMALVDKTKPANSKVFLRGNPGSRGPEVPRRFLEILSGPIRAPFQQGSGRLELAQEIASAKNPLTARVFVNRVWGWHFGQALVRTPSDFGVRTEAPVHRELLDWLAASFIESGWSLKQLHRRIVLSNTYQQSNDAAPATVAADPDNQLVHRFPRRRLEFEAMRDTLLAVSGALDLTAGGIPDDLNRQPFSARRTIYGYIDRQNLPGVFRTFDYPNPDTSAAQRFATTVPQQALFMMNSPFVLEQARQLAKRTGVEPAHGSAAAATRISEAGEGARERIHALYRVVLQRAPDDEELQLALAFVQRPKSKLVGSEAATSIGWLYGYGSFDADTNRVRDFNALTVRKENRLTPAESFPDETFGHLMLSATGGHPGKTEKFAGVLRWTAPGRGTVRIEATLGHGNAKGDGVRGRIVSSYTGKLGEWTVHNAKAETKLDTVEVRKGETIDFIVDALGIATFDGYTWSPTIAFSPHEEASDQVARTWNARKDFDVALKVIEPLTRWEELAQVLLLSNELTFVD